MRADYEEHQYTFLLYPYRRDVWRKGARPIQKLYIQLCNLISTYEPVILGTSIPIKSEVKLNANVKIFPMQYDDVWIRDTGLIPLSNGEFTKFQFNAWGGIEGLYQNWQLDQNVAFQMNQVIKGKVIESTLVLEGGNLSSDGKGTLIAIKNTILNDNRNPSRSINQIEKELCKFLNMKKIIWLEQGLIYDETGGHTDNLCVFVDSFTVFLAWTNDEKNPQYEVVHKAYEILESQTDAHGKKLKIIKIPLPKIFLRTKEDCDLLEINDSSKKRLFGEKIQASYINFIFVHNAVLVPQFEDEHDSIVVDIFKNFFKNKVVLPFPAREIVLGGGGMHCITKNI